MKGNTTAEERKNREAQRDSYKAANWAFVIKMTPERWRCPHGEASLN